MLHQSIYFFPGSISAPLTEVGGKGLSLILGSQARLPVPPGFILSVTFFAPWFEKLQESTAWASFLASEESQMKKACDALKRLAGELSFTPEQERELFEAVKRYNPGTLFAVRSSSPEEDLEGSSFAGGYETVLGVTREKLHSAIRHAFTSCLDYRIVVYKKENGFAITRPTIAVIVQEQIKSEIAGVGFSLNPVTNNFDEALFTANWGLGETVVSGIVTPDTYTVNKQTRAVTEKKLGKKEHALYLTASGEKAEKREKSTLFTLTDQQLNELTQLITSVEKLYHKPIDIEWAYANDHLSLIQARPITTYVPVSKAMQTQPGEPKRVYIDFTLTLQGITNPLSVTGTSFFRLVAKKAGTILFFRDITQDITSTIPWIEAGRMYLNLSNAFSLAGKKRVVNFLTIVDPLTARTIEAIDEKEYQFPTRKLQMIPFGIIRLLPRLLLTISQAKRSPKQTHRKTQQQLQHVRGKIEQVVREEPAYVRLTERLMQLLIDDVFLHTVPLFILGKISLSKMKKLAGPELTEQFAPLEIALPHNVTTEMGLALSHLAQLLPASLDQKKLLDGLHNQSLPEAFSLAWEAFLKDYGHRGPIEIDVAAKRYHDNPALLLDILLTVQKTSLADSPEKRFAKKQHESHEAYEYLLHQVRAKNPSQVKQFQKLYQLFETFGGYRETHKFYLALATDLLRQKLLKEGRSLYQAGRLETPEQVFDLTLEELDAAKEEASVDLKARAKKNRQVPDQLSRLPHLPAVIDSRGHILRPPTPPLQKGEVRGTPVSPGIISGPVKILHSPDEKPLNKGEILVARATDPGWTPLFVNAAAVILEVGGVLQHGALVAREYGLPCVTGIDSATSLWKDGTFVEVNGSEGSIRVLPSPERNSLLRKRGLHNLFVNVSDHSQKDNNSVS